MIDDDDDDDDEGDENMFFHQGLGLYLSLQMLAISFSKPFTRAVIWLARNSAGKFLPGHGTLMTTAGYVGHLCFMFPAAHMAPALVQGIVPSWMLRQLEVPKAGNWCG